MEQTPKQYVKEMIGKGWMKGNVRIYIYIYISNLLIQSYLQSDKEFYSKALRELDSF